MPDIVTIIDRRDLNTPWVVMWVIAIAIYFTTKLVMWWPQRRGASLWRQVAFVLATPGMDAKSFLHGEPPSPPALHEWLAASFKAVIGFTFTWFIARMFWPDRPMVAAWIGMVGVTLLLHFGVFHLIALTWRAAGFDAEPLMQRPLLSRSLADLWGRRWNTGFNAIARELLFEPLTPRVGAVAATGVVFFASGLIHDLVISLPARGGFGLPTLYFLIQFVGLLIERTPTLRRVRRSRILAWLYVALIALAPAPLLFHPPFVRRVIMPFLQAIGGLS